MALHERREAKEQNFRSRWHRRHAVGRDKESPQRRLAWNFVLALRWTAGGALYSLLEILCRGYTHWSMAVLAAVLCVPLDLTNNYLPWDWPLWLQAGIGGLIITAAELVAGLVLNVWLGLSIWDYTGQWGNLWGQICPRFTVLWCMLAGAVIILFDWLDYLTGDGKRPRYKIL